MNDQQQTYENIALHDVESSQISQLGYSPATKRLAIRFKRHGKNADQPGSLYHYENVSQEQYDAFTTAESLGTHFGKHFKSAVDAHPYTKIPEDE